MASYLGPESPTPINLVSNLYHKSLDLRKVQIENVDSDKLFTFDDGYYSKLCHLLWMKAELNIDDNLCLVCSDKSNLANELLKRLDLIHPIVQVNCRKLLYEDLNVANRLLNVGNIACGLEDYFSEQNEDGIKFDKIIVTDGLELVENRNVILRNMKNRLKDKNSNLVVMHRTSAMTTLPFYEEIISKFETSQIDVDDILLDFIELYMLIGWTVESIPVSISCLKWLNQLYNYYPPILESIPPPTNVAGGLRKLVDTSFKYSHDLDHLQLKDTFLLLVASNNPVFAGQPPYRLLSGELTNKKTSYEKWENLCRLKITRDIEERLPKNWEKLMTRYTDESAKNIREEYWGTSPYLTLGSNVDRSRLNKYL